MKKKRKYFYLVTAGLTRQSLALNLILYSSTCLSYEETTENYCSQEQLLAYITLGLHIRLILRLSEPSSTYSLVYCIFIPPDTSLSPCLRVEFSKLVIVAGYQFLSQNSCSNPTLHEHVSCASQPYSHDHTRLYGIFVSPFIFSQAYATTPFFPKTHSMAFDQN